MPEDYSDLNAWPIPACEVAAGDRILPRPRERDTTKWLRVTDVIRTGRHHLRIEFDGGKQWPNVPDDDELIAIKSIDV